MKKKLLLIIFLSAAFFMYSKDLEFSAKINHNKIGLQDLLTYTISFKGASDISEPDISAIRDFQIVQRSQSSGHSFVGWKHSYFRNYIYVLKPSAQGDLKIPSISYTYKNKVYKTREFTVKVVKGKLHSGSRTGSGFRSSLFDDDDFFSSPFSGRSRQREIDIFLKTDISKNSALQGEQLTFRVLMYTRNNISSIPMLLSSPSVPGFWLEWTEPGKTIKGRHAVINKKNYTVFEIKKGALYPAKTGTLTIPSLKFEIVTQDSGSFMARARRVTRETSPVKINVRALPVSAAGLPVGVFSLNVTTGSKAIDVNDILTYKISVTGSGNIKTLAPPELKSDDNIRVYPAKISRTLRQSASGLRGILTSEIPVSFRKTGEISIPPVTFEYFNIKTKRAVTLKSKALKIKVTGVREKEENTVSAGSSSVILKKGEDIDYINEGDINPESIRIHKTALFIILLILPFALNIIFAVYKFIFIPFFSSNRNLMNRKIVSKAIKEVEESRDFGEIHQIIENFIVQRTNIKHSRINTALISETLHKAGMYDRDIKKLIRYKEESESSRFSPVKKSVPEFREIKSEISELIKKADRSLK